MGGKSRKKVIDKNRRKRLTQQAKERDSVILRDIERRIEEKIERET